MAIAYKFSVLCYNALRIFNCICNNQFTLNLLNQNQIHISVLKYLRFYIAINSKSEKSVTVVNRLA